MSDERTRKAILMIQAIQRELAKGTIHRAEDGRILTTAREILAELKTGRKITLLAPNQFEKEIQLKKEEEKKQSLYEQMKRQRIRELEQGIERKKQKVDYIG